jgi:hypothetical protein
VLYCVLQSLVAARDLRFANDVRLASGHARSLLQSFPAQTEDVSMVVPPWIS